MSGKDVSLFLQNCPLLEELIVRYSDVEVCGAALVLKDLEVFGCHSENIVKASAPNLARLRAADGSGKLLLENVPNVVPADLKI